MVAKEIVFSLFFVVGSAGLVTAVLLWPALRRPYLSLFFLGSLEVVDINFLSREAYRGWVRGFELGTLDMILVGLGAAVLARCTGRRHRWLPPVVGWFAVFVALAALSAVGAYVPLYASFGLSKLVRALVVLWVVANAVRDEEDLRWVLWTLVAAVGWQGLVVVRDYLGGLYRARGSFDHSNTLGMYLNLLLPILFAHLLNQRHRLRWLVGAAFGLGAGAVVLTLSRGSWVSLALALAVVTPLSFALGTRPHKLVVLAVLAAVSLAPGVVAVEKMVRRVREAPASSAEARHVFNHSARAMAGDRLLGVGINNYSYGTDATVYAEPYSGGLDQGGLCHNLYYLLLGETGWPGLLAFLASLAAALRVAVVHLVRHLRDDLRSVWMVGFVGSFATVALQSWLEWALLQTVLSFTFFGLVGVAVAIPRLAAETRPTRWRVRWVPHPAP